MAEDDRDLEQLARLFGLRVVHVPAAAGGRDAEQRPRLEVVVAIRQWQRERQRLERGRAARRLRRRRAFHVCSP